MYRQLGLVVLFAFLTTAWNSPKKPIHVLLKMIPSQKVFFQKNILHEFEKKCQCKVIVHEFNDDWELTQKLKSSPVVYDVVKVPMNMARPLASQKLMHPLDTFISSKEGEDLSKTYFRLAEGKFEGKQYYLPRKFETRIMVYLKSQVKDAVQNWSKYKKQINTALKKVTYNELPRGYILEHKPEDWDYLDIFVVGFYWQLTSKGKGKICHRGKKYSGTSLGLMDRVYQMGATAKDVANPLSPYFTEVLRWESFYTSSNVYNHTAWSEGWGGREIWEAMSQKEVYLSFLTQVDCYFLQGMGEKKYLNQSADVGYATQPRAITLMKHTPKGKGITSGGWFWGVSAHSKQPSLALELIQTITNQKNQINELTHFGMIPVRKDIFSNVKMNLSPSWKNEVFKVSWQQMRLNGLRRPPYSENLDKLEQEYYQIWMQVVTASLDGFLRDDDIKKSQNRP